MAASADTNLDVDRLRFLVDVLPAFVAYVGSDARHVLANQQYRAVFGDVVGRSVHEDGGNRITAQVTSALSGKRLSHESNVSLCDGTIRHVHADLIPDVVDGVVRGCLVHARFVTKERDASTKEVLGRVGHELRNPLASITTALDLMDLKGDGFERERTVIRRHGKLLADLVDKLLDVSRLDALAAAQPVELDSVIARAIAGVGTLLEERKNELTLQIEPNLVLSGDRATLTRVFEHVIANAARFTGPRGRITIASRAERGSIITVIADNGRGIAPEQLPHIFEAFVHDERAAGQGLGLGLGIVRNLTELHDGSVTASSEGVGHGSTFTIELPAYDETAAVCRRRLLVVDDNQDAANILGEMMREVGYDVKIAYDAAAALEIASTFSPTIAVLDLGLPVVDGHELAKLLRGVLDNVKLVALTGYGPHADREKPAEFDVQLGKPIDFASLMRLLDTL